MRYLKRKSTGLILSGQSGGDPDNPLHLSTMVDDAVSGGIAKSDIEAGYCSEEEWEVMVVDAMPTREKVLEEIRKLENTVTPRRIREMTTDAGKKWVNDVEALIEIERGKL